MMKDHERTQLSYVAQALVRASVDQWQSILDVADQSADPSPSFRTALHAMRQGIERHRELKAIVEELVKSPDASAVTAGRVLAWSLEQLNSARPRPLESAPPR